MPETSKRTGAAAMMAVSTNTRSGFFGKSSMDSNTPLSVYMTATALQGASVAAIVGTIATGSLA